MIYYVRLFINSTGVLRKTNRYRDRERGWDRKTECMKKGNNLKMKR